MKRLLGPSLRKLLKTSVLSLCLAASSALAQVDGFKLASEADNLSQLIRSNTAHYWIYVADQKRNGALARYEGFKGIVSGDPHLGNFAVIPVIRADGKREMRDLNVDFDDAGIGSFGYDFARFVVTVKAIDKDVKIGALVDAYLVGLAGDEVEMPNTVRNAISLSMDEYDAIEADYIDKKTKGDSFRFKPGQLERYNAKYSKDEISALFPGATVLDLAIRPRERGGSVNATRIWVLAKLASGRTKIFELKERQPAAIEKYTAQPSIAALLPQIRAVFWPGISATNYSLVKLGKTKTLFWLREKKVALYDVPYGPEKYSEKLFIEEASLHVASLLGNAHGRQAQGRPYLAAIKKDVDQFREAIKATSKEYLALATATLDTRPTRARK